MLFSALLALPSLVMSSSYSCYHIRSGGSITRTTTGAYTCARASVAPYPSMKVVQERAEEAGKNGVDEPFSDLGLGDFVWAQAIQARVLLDTTTYWEASPNLYGMLLRGLEDCTAVEVKNVHEEHAMRYSAKCDTQLLVHILHLFKKVSLLRIWLFAAFFNATQVDYQTKREADFQDQIAALEGVIKAQADTIWEVGEWVMDLTKLVTDVSI